MVVKITLAGYLVAAGLQLDHKITLPDWPDYISIEGKGQYKKVGVSFHNQTNGFQNCDYEPTEEVATFTSLPRYALGGFSTVTKQQPPKACPFHGLKYGLEEVRVENGQFFGEYC